MKHKFELTSDIINEEDEKKFSSNEKITTENQRITITIATTPEYRSKIKVWCAKNNTTISQAFKVAFDELMSSV